MIHVINWKRLLFYWISSFTLASLFYYILALVMPGNRVFGSLFRMFPYHSTHPLQYIALPCFFYGIIASLFAGSFQKKNTLGRIYLTLFIILLTIFISSPFGGILWHWHDIQAGFFPKHWFSKLFGEGIKDGLGLGWLIMLLSIPYNLLGAIVCFFLTREGAKLFNTNR